MSFFSLIAQTFAGLLLVVGLVAMLSPIPLGLPIVVFSLAVLIMTNPRVADLVRRIRQGRPELDERIRGVEDHLPGPLAEPLRRTDP